MKIVNTIDLWSYFKDEDACLKHLHSKINNGKIICPRCFFERVYCYKDGIRFKCAKCKKQFTAKIGTIFQCSQVPLMKWYVAIYMLGCSKQGINAVELCKQLGVTRRIAWFMSHRIRIVMGQTDKVSCNKKIGNRESVLDIPYDLLRNETAPKYITKPIQILFG